MSSNLPLFLVPSILLILATIWLISVNKNVPKPYLDEIFHIRQALIYNANQFSTWDPKITTPPGLYLLSWLGLKASSLIGLDANPLAQLRSHNVFGILGIFFVLFYSGRTRRPTTRSRITCSWTSLNITLFPPLFFFSGLYYTDVISVSFVLAAHRAFERKKPWQVLGWSIGSLWFRQTNVFWTAVYLGGREVVRVLKERQRPGRVSGSGAWMDVIEMAWRERVVFDQDVSEAGVEGEFASHNRNLLTRYIDYIKLILSLTVVAIKNVRSLMQPLLPYLTTLAAFASFVLWNGGVVLGLMVLATRLTLISLGDKENHIASLHLPQMLYIWPYIAFFSWPVILPSLISNVLGLLPTSSIPTFLSIHKSTLKSTPRPRLVILLPVLVLTLIIIHYNTLVHPFTLADNRHYTFYFFRLLLRRTTITKYLLAPTYLFFAWSCIGALAPPARRTTQTAKSKDKLAEIQTVTPQSTLLLWLITSTLSLATAPLVEPRYFILPWIIWRLHVVTDVSAVETKPPSRKDSKSQSRELTGRKDITAWLLFSSLPLETLWYLTVNAVTCYVFLKKGFAWPNEPGEIQRFMW